MTNPHHACDDFHSTSESRRRSFLDTPLSRRQVIGRGIGAGIAIYAAKAMPFMRILEAAEAQAAAAPAAPILVTVFLPGGCDLLDTIVPSNQFGRYADLRPGLKVDPLALGSTGLGANPHLGDGLNGGVKGLFDAGKIGLLPGIDYANPDLSHFHSRHFWETGLITQSSATGWLGRWLDHVGSKDNPLQGLSMDASLSPVMRAGSSPVAAVSSPDDAQFWIPGMWGDAFEYAMETWAQIASARPYAPGPAAAYAGARQAKSVADILAPYVKDDKTGTDPLAGSITYPEGDLADKLKALAGLLSLPLGTRAVTVDADGDFDTHDNQAGDLGDGLSKVSGALASFQADIEARGLGDRVITLVWSEFGRRPQQNESGGTDHGAGGVAWVQGTRVRSGVLSDYPDLNRLDREDNLAVTVDFRRVYASLLEQWLGTDATAVIPNAGALGRLQLVA